VKPELPQVKLRLILCWEVNNCAVLQSTGGNFNVIFETCDFNESGVSEKYLKTHNDGKSGNDMTLKFSHRPSCLLYFQEESCSF